MKRKNILTAIAGGCLVLGGLTSCEDFLTLYPTNQITEEEFWEDKGDVESGMMACYVRMTNKNLQQKVLHWGEGRSDNSVVQDQGNSSIVNLKAGILEDTEGMFSWSPFYTAINYCNKVIENVPVVAERDPSFNAGEQQQYIVEAKTLRALNYFYLVRAFRDVPLVLQSISTDAEAFNAQVPQTPGLQVLDTLIADLDTIKDLGALTYASSSERCGRVTRLATYTLLADMYLWRACMLKEAEAKGYRFDSLSTSITEATADEQSEADLNKVIEYCDYVIDELRERKRAFSFGFGEDEESDQQEDMYPLILQEMAFDGALDEVFSQIFGMKNSVESILELQFDGSSIINDTWTESMTSTSDGIVGKMYSINPSLYANIGQVNPEIGFGSCDMRALENTRLEGSQSNYLYYKGTLSSLGFESMTNMSEGTMSSSIRANASNAFNWIIYRLSDVLLMKAEAIARLSEPSEDQLKEGYLMTNAIFQRSNPTCTTQSESSGGNAPVSDRCDENYYSGKSAATLLSLVYRERQREFLGEYKRWFDLVRYAEAQNSTEDALSMMGADRALQTRLRRLDSFYNPVTEDEMKINSALKQNPAWNDETVGAN